MKLSELIMNHGLQKTLIIVDDRTKIDILCYIPTWVERCKKLIEISTEIYNITQGNRYGHFWVTANNKMITYGEIFTKMLDLEEELSNTYTSDWMFKNIMIYTERGNWTLQNKLVSEFHGARKIEFSNETAKMNEFMKGQRDLKWMIIHVAKFINIGKAILNS
jgi:hypothetical protein